MTGREDAFERALAALRERLDAGEFRPGGRIPASALAARLRLSATPVREALCRLAGEGLVEERRNQGFFVRTLTGVEVADLYRIRLAHLLILVRHDRERRAAAAEARTRPPGTAVRGFFDLWVSQAASRALAVGHRVVQTQLAAVQRLEDRVIPDLETETDDLLALAEAGEATAFAQALRRYHARRIQVSDRLAAILNGPAKI